MSGFRVGMNEFPKVVLLRADGRGITTGRKQLQYTWTFGHYDLTMAPLVDGLLSFRPASQRNRCPEIRRMLYPPRTKTTAPR